MRHHATIERRYRRWVSWRIATGAPDTASAPRSAGAWGQNR